MTEVGTIGDDFAKTVFHLHGTGEDGSVVFRKKVNRTEFLKTLNLKL